MSWRIIHADVLDGLAALPERSVQTCITSPPYFGLRDYGMPGQIGLEPTPDEFVTALVAVFREVRRVLRDDGTVWLNLGDSYAGWWGAQSRGGPPSEASTLRGNGHVGGGPKAKSLSAVQIEAHPKGTRTGSIPEGAPYKPKDLLGIPWMVAFALRADGWYLRSEIVWAKPNPMPESVTDRPTRAHEQVFLLSKSPRYFYDAEAIREESEPAQEAHNRRYAREYDAHTANVANGSSQPGNVGNVGIHARPGPPGRNKRSVWTVATQPYAEAHFATFPPKLIEPMVLAGSPSACCAECGAPRERVVERTSMVVREGPGRAGLKEAAGIGSSTRTAVTGTMLEPPTSRTVGWAPTCDHAAPDAPAVVLDPFCGSGTTGLVALRHGRSFIGVELNAEYVELARRRICDDAPLFNTGSELVA